MNRFDVAIVGGGMAGATAAAGLGQAGFSVALIDPKSPLDINSDDTLQLRVSTLSPASKNVLDALGAWAVIADSGRCSAFDSMRVWQRDERDELRFQASDAQLSQLGWVVENELVRSALWQQFDRANVVHFDTALERAEIAERSVSITLGDNQSIKASLLIGADGPQSRVRTAAGIDIDSHSYGQHGLVCVVETRQPHQATAWQRFLPGGPLGLLPLNNGHSSIVWSLPEQQALQLCAADQATFDAATTAALDDRLGSVTCQGKRVSFPLRRQSAQRYISKRVVLIGDAAHVIHPLAGQGANLGLLDAAMLIEQLIAACEAGRNIADPHYLRRFERSRRSDNQLMVGSLELVKTWFAQERGVLADIRRLGTSLITRNDFLRARLVAHASGFGGQPPRLALGVASDRHQASR